MSFKSEMPTLTSSEVKASGTSQGQAPVVADLEDQSEPAQVPGLCPVQVAERARKRWIQKLHKDKL